jgi:acetolactate synthase-1/2/3 large subunit
MGVGNGADQLCAELEAAGVSCVLGVPGTQNVALFEALRKSRLRTVVTTNELTASFMANGYYRASGRVAPVLTIPGPGFTFALTGVAEARHDSAALLHLVGAPPRATRKFQFQALDQRAIASSMVKGVVVLDHPEDVAVRVAEALHLATSGEPGPVLLEWTPEALAARTAEASAPTPPPSPVLAPAEMDRLRAWLAGARRPLLLVGQGCAADALLVQRLAEACPAPVLTTGSGRGILAEDHPFSLAFDFARGDVGKLNALLRSTDLVLALGAKLTAAGTSFFGVELPEDRLVHVDASHEVAGGSYPARLAVVSPVAPVLEGLLAGLPPAAGRASDWTRERLAEARRDLYSAHGEGLPEPVVHGVPGGTAAAFFSALRRALPREAIVVADSGLHQFLVRRHLDILSPRGLIVPSDLQSIGFAVPAAIGARLGAPDRPVVAVVGDGGFAATGLELLTAVREKIALTVVVFNDGYLNLIRIAQLADSGRTIGIDLHNPDFEGLAAAIGADYALVSGDAEAVIREAAASSRVTLVELRLGDSMGMRAGAAKARARGWTSDLLGPGAVTWLKRRLRRR